MRLYINLTVLALAASIISPALSAPLARYGNLHTEFKGCDNLISGSL